jgi:hypothetical protein
MSLQFLLVLSFESHLGRPAQRELFACGPGCVHPARDVCRDAAAREILYSRSVACGNLT